MLFDPDPAEKDEKEHAVEEGASKPPVGALTAAALVLAISMALWIVIYLAVLVFSR